MSLLPFLLHAYAPCARIQFRKDFFGIENILLSMELTQKKMVQVVNNWRVAGKSFNNFKMISSLEQ